MRQSSRFGDHLESLIDSGSSLNLVSRRVAQKLELVPDGPPVKAQTITGSPLNLLAKYTLDITVADSLGVTKTFTQEFYSTPDVSDDITLGIPWLRAQGSASYDWVSGRWRYEEGLKIELVSAAEFIEKDMKENPVVYSLFLTDNRNGLIVASVSIGTAPMEIPEEYRDFKDVFSAEDASLLPDEGGAFHAIEITADPPYGPIYPLSAVQLRILREYLEENLRRGWITPSTSPAGAPVLFVPKKDGTLRLCVDYRGLNRVTIKNRHPLPLIDEMLDRLAGAKYYTRLDLRDAYHRIRIKVGDEWKTAFRTRYGHFEYRVMPFGLANAPATFQAYINRTLHGLIDTTCIVFLDDILIYSKTEEEHQRHVREVLARLRQYKLYAKLSKCAFKTKKVEFLGFIVGEDGVSVDPDRIRTITEWPEPRTFREVQQFLGFANFYRRFIYRYSRIVAPLTDLLVGSKNGKKEGTFTFPDTAREAFANLKTAFTTTPVLAHFNTRAAIRVITDASGGGAAGIMLQPDQEGSEPASRHFHPVAFWSRKLTDVERRYETYDKELLAIVECFKHWRHYLEGSRYPTEVYSDHNNLRYFMTTKQLNGRQARWAMTLSAFDFEVRHLAGKVNPADAPSRRPDYVSEGGLWMEDILPTFQAKLRGTFMKNMMAACQERPSGVTGAVTQSGVMQSVQEVLRYHACVVQGPHAQGEDESSVQVGAVSESSSSRPAELRGSREVSSAVAGGIKKRHSVPTDYSMDLELSAVNRHLPGVPRAVSRTCAGAEVVYDPPQEPIQSLILILQQGDAFVKRKKEGLGAQNDSETSTEQDSVNSWSDSEDGEDGVTSMEQDSNSRGPVHRGGIGLRPTPKLVKSGMPQGLPEGSVNPEGTPHDAIEHKFADRISGQDQGSDQSKDPGRERPGEERRFWSVNPEGLLCRDNAIFVPDDQAVRQELLKVHHDDPLAGHFGTDKTYELLRRKFFWPGMQQDISDYITSCFKCQSNKAHRHKPYGKLNSLPQPSGPWQEITMDFITDLPVSRFDNNEYDSILVVVDRYTKMTRYIPVTKTIDAVQLATKFIDQIVRFFGIPKGIVSDRGSVFTSNYWSELCYQLRVTRRLSTAFHPQTDGQTERQNQTLEAYLRSYCNESKNDWVRLLALAEFSYNNARHSTTGQSPFRAMYGYDPMLAVQAEPSSANREVPATTDRLKEIARVRNQLEKRWNTAVKAQAKYYNNKHQPQTFNVGQWVMLSTKNIRFRSGKLTEKFIGPFKVLDVIGNQAYKLDLPQLYERLHPVFHVSLLEPYHARPEEQPGTWQGPELAPETEQEWEVEALLGKRQKGRKVQYLVRWEGWPKAYDQWVDLEPDLQNAKKLIQEYEADHNTEPKEKRGRKRRA